MAKVTFNDIITAVLEQTPAPRDKIFIDKKWVNIILLIALVAYLGYFFHRAQIYILMKKHGWPYSRRTLYNWIASYQSNDGEQLVTDRLLQYIIKDLKGEV